MEEEKVLHAMQIGTSDLQAIGHVLTIYAQGIRSINITSPKREAYLDHVQMLRERIGVMKTESVAGLEHDFPLTYAELDIIDSAFTVFIDTMNQSVPPSEERDEVIRGCKALRASILSGSSLSDTVW